MPSCAPSLCTGVASACGSSCQSDSDCASSSYCRLLDGTCHTDQANGATCSAGTQCQSGFCVDGVCCNGACGGVCLACSAATKASGVDDGICDFAKNGSDPHDNCQAQGAPTCQQDGECDGKGACRKYALGTVCGPTSCVNNVQTGYACNGAGSCLGGQAIDCGAFLCTSGACKTSCTTEADCASDGYCDAGVCKTEQPNGQPCSVKEACTSHLCVDGVCCNALCGAQCEACDVEGAEGTCVPVSGKPHASRADCASGTPDNPCVEALCDGNVRESCAGFVGASVVCRQGGCEDGTETVPASCNGHGQCPDAQTKLCDPYACGEVACNASCTSQADCSPGSRCIAETGKCVPGATCESDRISIDENGNRTDCTPYRCDVSGVCKKSCGSANDCAASFLCNPDGQCVSASGEGEGAGGCACRTRSGRGNETTAALAALLAALACLRNKRRAEGLSKMRPYARPTHRLWRSRVDRGMGGPAEFTSAGGRGASPLRGTERCSNERRR